MLYNVDVPGEWGRMQAREPAQTAIEMLAMDDGCKLFLRSWRTEGQDVLLLLHGLGAHSGWFIDMGNELAARGLTTYAVDHRGFGRSAGVPGHIERYATYIEDLVTLLKELKQRHASGAEAARMYILGHSMGGVFATYLAAWHADLLDGVIFLPYAAP